jgi:CDK inhibitor PHO81
MVALRNIIRYSDTLVNQSGGKTNVSRILWKAAIDSPPELADLILSTPASSFDFLFVDDINGRTCLHQAAIAGVLRLVEICLDKGVPPAKTDAYGRSALHYAAMNGHADVCRLLLGVKVPADVVDMDNFTPLIHATLKGSVDCIRILLNEGGIAVQPRSMADLFPLSLASRTGHLDVVVLLLEHGAESIPNSNGEYPIHLAAREGHVKICELLVRHDGWDVPDKYNEWTPLFHAARWGHDTCIQVLLEAGCKVNAVDEFVNSPVHYAAWYGHHAAVTLLLEAAGSILTAYQTPRSDFSPDPAETQTEDVDMIPTLSLPPPIMPYRVYGHNYLDKNCLVQISIGRTSPVWTSQSQNNSAVRLYPPFMDAEYQQSYLHSSPLFKLVMTASPDATSAPYSVPLPLQKNGVLFSFQVPSFDELCLEFSLYPNFGTKTIGRAVALPALLRNLQDGSAQILPVLDHRLHVIGEVNAYSMF